MVQVKYGAIITDMKGKIGGQTFKGNYTAPSCQNIVKPIQIFTNFNQLPKTNLAYIAGTWRALTNAQRIGFNDFAEEYPFYNCFGELYYGSGFQSYMSINCNLASVGLPLHDTAVELVEDFTFTNVSGVWSSVMNNCTLTFDGITALGNWLVNVKASDMFSVGKYAPNRKLASIFVIPSANATVNVIWSVNYGLHFKNAPQTFTWRKIMIQLKAINSITGQGVQYNSLFLNSPL